MSLLILKNLNNNCFSLRNGSALITILGLLFVLFIFAFGYSNYLNGQVYFLEREKYYEAAKFIVKSAFNETLYLINYDNAEFISKLKNINKSNFLKPFIFYEAKVEATTKLMQKIFEKSDKPTLRVWYELNNIVDFKIEPMANEKFAFFKLHGLFKSGLISVKLEYEIIGRLSKIEYNNNNGIAYLKLSPERVFAIIENDENIKHNKYYGICIYKGNNPKLAKKYADSNDEFRALLVQTNGAIITDKSLQYDSYCLTFSPPIIRDESNEKF